MRTLNGASIALLEARMSEEMSALVRRYDGRPRSAPALRESPRRETAEVAAFLDRLCGDAFSLGIFLTGVGVTTLLKEAEQLGRIDNTIAALRRLRIACRGSKPTAALRQRGVPAQITAREPFTTVELLEALDAVDLAGVHTALVHYGERSDTFAATLAARGALLYEICLYEWLLPEDTTPLRTLIADVLAGQIDSVVFTTKVQCRHLFRIAAELGRASELADALNTRTTVAVIGPVCRAALKEHGVVSHVMPATPKMAPLVSAIAEHFELSLDKTET